jgi:acetyl esterase/lipase
VSEVVEWRDEVWRDGMLARVYEPPDAARAAREGAAVVNVHGGAWAMGDRTHSDTYCRAVAAAGFVVVAIEFRDGRVARHPAAVEDVAHGVRWVRAEAGRLRGDAPRVALMGSSSGGHLALHAALTEVDVPFVAALWPPVDPLARYRYAQGCIGQPVPDGQTFHPTRLVRSSEAYFGDEATMEASSISTLLRTGRARWLPPVWLVRAGADLNVPAAILDTLAGDYAAAGGTLELTDYPGQVHGFGHGEHAEARRFHAELTVRLIAALG